MLNAVLLPFMVLSAIGFVLSVTAHVLALLGGPIPGGGLVWGLHIGIFGVWIPAVLVSIQMTRFGNRRDFWKIALGGCPPRMRYALYILIGYAVLNFILFIVAGPASTHTRSLGDTPPPTVVRGFSGHWMVFYAIAFAILYSRINAPQLFKERKCPNGHVVSPTARFCPDCGYAFPDLVGNT